MPFYEQGNGRIPYEAAGSGFPLMIIPGGGLNATMAWNAKGAPFNPVAECRHESRCLTADLRHASSGQSSGPLEVDRPWEAYADDQLGVMDHLGLKRCMVVGFCIGGPFIWNLWQRAPDRLVAAVASPPSGWRQALPNLAYESHRQGWGPEITQRRPDLSMARVGRLLTRMYRGAAADFVDGVSREFVRACQAPVLVLPDDAPKADVSRVPWQDATDKMPVAVRQVRSGLRAHRPARACRRERP